MRQRYLARLRKRWWFTDNFWWPARESNQYGIHRSLFNRRGLAPCPQSRSIPIKHERSWTPNHQADESKDWIPPTLITVNKHTINPEPITHHIPEFYTSYPRIVETQNPRKLEKKQRLRLHLQHVKRSCQPKHRMYEYSEKSSNQGLEQDMFACKSSCRLCQSDLVYICCSWTLPIPMEKMKTPRSVPNLAHVRTKNA